MHFNWTWQNRHTDQNILLQSCLFGIHWNKWEQKCESVYEVNNKIKMFDSKNQHQVVSSRQLLSGTKTCSKNIGNNVHITIGATANYIIEEVAHHFWYTLKRWMNLRFIKYCFALVSITQRFGMMSYHMQCSNMTFIWTLHTVDTLNC